MEEYSFAKSTDLDLPVHVRVFVTLRVCSANIPLILEVERASTVPTILPHSPLCCNDLT